MPSLANLAYTIGIVVFLGTAAVYLRGSRDKGTIDSLERQNAAFKEEIAGLHTQVDALQARVTHLESENAGLRSQRPSADAIADLAQKVADLAEKQVAGVSRQITQHDADVKNLLGKGPP